MNIKKQTTLPPKKLDDAFSLYLDLCRFLAAVLVVVAHYLSFNIIKNGQFISFPNMGREAVIVFFVLSGFVIAYTTEVKTLTVREYILARCTRIYSVAIPTITLGFLLDVFISKYTGNSASYQLQKLYLYLPIHLFFMGQSWTLSEVPPLLAPYWSLCFEVWYYALFGAAYYMKGLKRFVGIFLILMVMGYKLWLLLPVWLSGVAIYHLQSRYQISQNIARTGFLLSLFTLCIYNINDYEMLLRAHGVSIWPFEEIDLGSAERYLADYLVCVLVGMNFYCARFANFSKILQWGSIIRRGAAYTFTLYLSHMLFVLVWLAIYPHDPESIIDVTIISFAVVATTVGLGQLTERRKHIFSIGVINLFKFFIALPSLILVKKI